MSELQQAGSKQTIESLSSSSSSISPSNSISLIKLDELSSFGATKQNRLPTLIKLNSLENHQQQQQQQQARNTQANSMPAFSVDQLEQSRMAADKQQTSLPNNLQQIPGASSSATNEKENLASDMVEPMNATDCVELVAGGNNPADDFQVVEMVDQQVLMGPSLQSAAATSDNRDKTQVGNEQELSCSNNNKVLPADELEQQLQRQVLSSISNQQPSHLGDSLIEMIINYRNENQNLVRALETNNEYVKDRLNEFKRTQEEAKKREAQFAMEKAEFEHQNRKLQRQNQVLSERLKSMEAKLKDLNLEVRESLNAAHSSKASSIRGADEASSSNLYPQLNDGEEFNNSALNQATTMQIDAANEELHNGTKEDESSASESEDEEDNHNELPNANQASTSDALKLAQMSKEELSKRFDANKAQFYSMDDPMKQCDELEKQLNDIGKRDYEICLLQQQLNIYRQDFRLERMAKLEARIQIEKLKNDIDRLCLDRIQEQQRAGSPKEHHSHRHHSHRRSRGRFDPAVAAAEAVIGKLGHQLSKKAAKSAAKAAKFAAKQAHREEKAAVFAAATAAAAAAATSGSNQQQGAQVNQQPEGYYGHHHGHRRHHSSHHHHHNQNPTSSSSQRPKSIRSEVVSDLLSTANKAMLTGYKMASTHVNLALDKLSAFEQAQAANLASNKQQAAESATMSGKVTGDGEPSAPMGPPSVD